MQDTTTVLNVCGVRRPNLRIRLDPCLVSSSVVVVVVVVVVAVVVVFGAVVGSVPVCVCVRVFWDEALKAVGCELIVAEHARLTDFGWLA